VPTIPGSPGLLRAAAHEVLRRPEVLAVALVDVASGLTLDAVTADRARLDVEAVAATQVEALRGCVELGRVLRGTPTEVVVRQGTAVLHVLRPVPDPGSAAGLLLSVLVAAPERNLRRVRKALDRLDPRSLVPPAPPVVARPREVRSDPASDARLAELPRFQPGPSHPTPSGIPAARSEGRSAVPAALAAPTAPTPAPAPPAPPAPSTSPTAPSASSREATQPLPVLLSVGPAASEVKWFEPVVPGSPPPPRRVVETPAEPPPLVVRRRP